MRKQAWLFIGVFMLSGIFCQSLMAQDDDAAFEELLVLLQEDVTISSRVSSSEEEAPGIVTIITAKQIRDMGARTLLDVLQIVPGFNVLPYNIEGFPFEMYYVRGIVNYTNANVLLLHNGARMNEFFSGSARKTFKPMKSASATIYQSW